MEMTFYRLIILTHKENGKRYPINSRSALLMSTFSPMKMKEILQFYDTVICLKLLLTM
jgi:hypothetical protein